MQGRKHFLRNPWLIWLFALMLSLAGFLHFGGSAQSLVEDACETGTRLTPLTRLTGGPGGMGLEDGTAVTIEAVITGLFPGRDGLNGLFVQQGGPGQGEPAVGLFVYAPGFTPADWERLEAGQRIQLDGLAGSHRGRPQLQRAEALRVCAEGMLPMPVALELPLDQDTLEAHHGVLVHFPQVLTVTGNYTLGRHGTLKLSHDGRLFRHGLMESAGRSGQGGQHDLGQGGRRGDQRAPGYLHRIILDDGNYRSNPRPVPYLDDSGTRRAGDSVEQLTGVLVHAFDDWRLHPTKAPSFTSRNPRPKAPEPLEGLRVATFNLENYFLTLGRRGASDAAGLERQRGRLLAALEAKNADLLALVEVENRREVLQDLVDRLNARLPGDDHYRMLEGPADTGSDAIKVALIYRPRLLDTLGPAVADNHPVHHRPPVMAAFRDRRSGERFIATAVHFKAKVGCPSRGDVDRGQGCWNERRSAQARALLEAVAGKSRSRGIEQVLLAGDFNSYAGEDPIRIIQDAGYQNTVATHLPKERQYSFVFRGEAGTLDYIFASGALAARVTAATIWHINADEPVFLGYGQSGGMNEANRDQPWRSSDHDPVMIGIEW